MRRKTVVVSIVGLCILGVAGLGAASYVKSRRSFELVEPKHGPIVESVYSLGKVRTDDRYEVKVGVMTTVLKLFAGEGVSVSHGQPLVRFEGANFAAPFDGTVTKVFFQENEIATPNMPVLRLEGMRRRYVEISLDQESALRVRPGQDVKILFETLRGQVLQGKVASIFARDEEFVARINAPNLPENVLPGMTADVAIEVAKRDNALLVPLSAVSNARVLVSRGEHREVVEIEVGTVDDQWAEVVKGDLRDGDLVVVQKKTDQKKSGG